MTESVKLEPCPFCGCEAEFHPTFWGLQPQISCQCGAKVWAHSEAEALSAWNTRTAAQPEREAVLLDDIAAMMSEFVDNWPKPKRVSTALALIAKTIRAALKTTPAPAVSRGDVLAGAIDAAMTDLDLLRRAIEEDDPKAELLIRTTDTWRRLNDAILSRLWGEGE